MKRKTQDFRFSYKRTPKAQHRFKDKRHPEPDPKFFKKSESSYALRKQISHRLTLTTGCSFSNL
jgi:hypothetical protein